MHPYDTLIGKDDQTVDRELEQLIRSLELTVENASQWLVDRFAPAGPITEEENVSYVYKTLWGLWAMETYPNEVNRLLDWLHETAVRPNGDLYFAHEPPAERDATRGYRQTTLLRVAANLGHPLASDERVRRRIVQYQDPASGGAFAFLGNDVDNPVFPD